MHNTVGLKSLWKLEYLRSLSTFGFGLNGAAVGAPMRCLRGGCRGAESIMQKKHQLNLVRHLVETTDKAKSLEEVEEERKANFKDSFVPLTRRTLIQQLMSHKEVRLGMEERQVFEKFACALDSALVTRLDADVGPLKALFDSLNPDKDTAETRRYNRRERLDNEFWLLQRFTRVLQTANFHELPRSLIEDALGERNVGGVRVSSLPDQYAVLRYWALGSMSRPWPAGRWYRASPVRQKYYRRVIVALRPKTEDRLMLKAFKEVPVDRLEQLVPAGTLRMTLLDQGLLVASGAFGLGSMFAALLSHWFSVPTAWALPLVAASVVSSVLVWTSFKNRQQVRLIEHQSTLYFKNIINNRGLLMLIVNKAKDETFKEALLTYTFLLTADRASSSPTETAKGGDTGSLTVLQLERRVSDWLHSITAAPIAFDCTASVRLLSSLGLLSHDQSSLHALTLPSALRLLPPPAHTPLGLGPVGSRVDDYDAVEGLELERSILESHDEDFTIADRIRQRLPASPL